MQNSGNVSFFEQVLHSVFNRQLKVLDTTFKSGGCINNALKIHTNEVDYFLKLQTGIPQDMFAKEEAGLKILNQATSIKIPEVYGKGVLDDRHYLLMEYVDQTLPVKNYWEEFGTALAQMHRNNSNRNYGLDHDNYIGKLPQPNGQSEDWISFFIENRLEYQLELAIKNQLVDQGLIDRYRRFYKELPNLLPVDKPALLHGDLWSGNVMVGKEGQVCLIDPAVYFGHREIELAFTQMFGGFSRAFYQAYHEEYPIDPGFDQRVEIYNMYPHMVHVNLFGPSYLSGVVSVLKKYVD
jgi:fructosamine-3-kinase